MRQLYSIVGLTLMLLSGAGEAQAQVRDLTLISDSAAISANVQLQVQAAQERVGNSKRDHIFLGAIVGAAVGLVLGTTGVIGNAYPIINVLEFAAVGALGGLIVYALRQ